jgi:hypothetical protein
VARKEWPSPGASSHKDVLGHVNMFIGTTNGGTFFASDDDTH